MKHYVVTYTLTTRETWQVEADSKADALLKAKVADHAQRLDVVSDRWVVASDVSPLKEEA